MHWQDDTRLLERPLFNKLLITGAAATWGLSFVVMKDLVDKVPVFWLLAVRNLLATAVMALVLRGRLASALRDRHVVRLGLLLGALNFLGYATQTIGLTMTTPGKNSFFTGTYCVMVPFVAWLFGRGRPRATSLVAAATCVAGIGLVAMSGTAPFNLGDALTLVCAVGYATQYVCLAKWGDGTDAAVITTLEFAVMAACSGVVTLLFERGTAVPALTTADFAALAFLVLVCSCLDFVAINHGMMHVDTAEGAILSALEAPFGVLGSVLFYHEPVTLRLLAGFGLIFVAIVLSETGDELLARLRR